MTSNRNLIIGLVAVLAILCFWGIIAYNGMVSQEEEVQKQWANVQNQYQRRFDLIPNLVSTVKGYAQHESSTLENVTNARAGVTKAEQDLLQANEEAKASSTDPDKAVKAYDKFDRSLGLYINAVHEAYPDLKASQNFMDLQTQLEGTENRVATERTRYNEAVKNYNVKIRRFPNSIIAGITGFDKKEQFNAVNEAQTAPKVEF